jgi:hypothetical protein
MTPASDDFVVVRQLARQKIFAAKTNEAFRRVDCVPRFDRTDTTGSRPNHWGTGFWKMNDRRGKARAMCIGQQDGEARFHHANQRIRRPKIDSNDIVLHATEPIP